MWKLSILEDVLMGLLLFSCFQYIYSMTFLFISLFSVIINDLDRSTKLYTWKFMELYGAA